MKKKSAFSLLEVSIVVLIIGMLLAGVIKGSRLLTTSRIITAQSLTKASPVAGMPDLVAWFETSMDENIINTNGISSPEDRQKILTWKEYNPQKLEGDKVAVIQTNSTYQPAYVTDGINDLPSIRFTGNNSFITAIGNATPLPAGSDAYTLIGVWQVDSTAASAQQYIFVQGNLLEADWANKVASLFIQSNDLFGFSGGQNNYYNLSLTKGIPYITIIKIDNSLANNYSIHSNSNTVSASGFTSSGGPLALDLRADYFGIGLGVYGLVSEIIIFNRVLKNYEITAINRYLSKKYNIRVSL